MTVSFVKVSIFFFLLLRHRIIYGADPLQLGESGTKTAAAYEGNEIDSPCQEASLSGAAKKPKAFHLPPLQNPENSLMREKDFIYQTLLAKSHAGISHDLSRGIRWDNLKCTGWPTEVKSKFPHFWTADDVRILKNCLDSINFEPISKSEESNSCDIVPNLDPSEVRNDAQRMLAGTYNNPTFLRFTQLYRIRSSIGSGSFGFVLKCERISDSVEVAVKFIVKPNLERFSWAENETYGRVPIEVDILQSVSHPSIIELIDYFDDGVYAYMVTEIFGVAWYIGNPSLTRPKNPLLRWPKGAMPRADTDAAYDLFQCIECHSSFSDELIHFIFDQIHRAVVYLIDKGICHGDLKC